jgi:hypothetical protein
VDIIGNQIFKSEKDPFTIIKNINGKEKKMDYYNRPGISDLYSTTKIQG